MKHLLKLIACLLLFQNCIAQQNADSVLNILAKKLLDDVGTADKEKVLLVTDRKIYTIGETVYFKAFIVDSVGGYLQKTPQKLYVDWVDKKDRVINQLVLDNSNFQTSGQFVLPDSLSEGFYWIRAYTKMMLKNNINNIAVAPLYLVNGNATRKAVAQSSAEDDKPILKFYPEGGSIISGLNSTVAVSAKNKNGEPLIVSGIVKDNHDSIAATFTTNKYGLAKFSYFPKWFYSYKILLKHNDGYDSSGVLPKVNFFAAQLAVVQQSNGYVTAQVALEDSIYSKDFTTYTLAVSKDSVCFAGVGRGMYKVDIPQSKFPAGIATLYLLNTNGEILSSRNIYIKKDSYHLIVQADKKNYAARDKIKLNFEITDANNQPEVAALSLSVADQNLLDTSLSYFPTDTLKDLSPEDADLIMLTQNEKENSLHSNNNQFNNDNDSAFTLSGKIVNLKDEPIANAVITIFSNKSIVFAETDTLNKDGKFKILLPPYTANTLFTVQLNDLKGKQITAYEVIFDADTLTHFSTPSYLKKIFSLAGIQLIKAQFAAFDSADASGNKHWLKPVTVNGYSNAANYDSSKRVSRFSHIITNEMIGNGPGMAGNALLDVPGIRLMNGYVIAGSPNGFSDVTAKDEPLVVFDGVEMNVSEGYTQNSKGSPVTNFLNSLPVTTIDFIEVLTGPEAAAYGMEGAKGVIIVNTASKDENILATTTGLRNFYAKGFYIDKPFEIPDYTNRQVQKSKTSDLRKTIYWNGNIVTDKDGKTSVEFFAADEATTYIGIITGVTINGDKIYQTFTISRN